MNSHELGMRFTNEKYATKSEVSKELQISLIDKIWNEILEYRAFFSQILRIKTIDGPSFSVCMFPNLTTRLSRTEKRILKLNNQVKNINDGNSKWLFSKKANALVLKSIADHLNINIDDESLLGLAGNNISATKPEFIILANYCSLINNLKTCDVIDETQLSTFLNDVAVDLLGKDNSFYRTRNTSNNSNSIYSGVYNEAPATMIGSLMELMFEFIEHNALDSSYLLQMAVIVFYMTYVKPYTEYNEEIAFLVAKYLLRINDLEYVSSILNIENVLNNKKYDAVFEETQKSCDFTYYLLSFLDVVEESISDLEKLVSENVINEVKNDFYKPEDAETKQPDIIPQAEENIGQVEVKKYNNESFILNSTNETASQKPQINEDSLSIFRDAAITSVTLGYSEEEAQKVETYLLESDPNLTQSQAYFYARHCTMNKYYTISQYKNALRCAYETARTSMDKLVFNGYYKKEAHKNKFIYTPVRKK